MNILITGASGYIGKELTNNLIISKHKVRILLKKNTDLKQNSKNIEIIRGDILSDSDLDKACKGIDIVIHLAALDVSGCATEPETGILINGIGTRKLSIASSKNNVKKIIYFSTFHVYGKSEGYINELTITSPKSDYAISKLAGEHYCQNFCKNTNYTILRLSNVIGYSESVNGNTLILNDITKQCIDKGDIFLKTAGNQQRNFVSISDIISAVNIVINSSDSDNKIFNVGGKESISIYELAKRVSKTYEKMYNKKVTITIGEKSEIKKINKLNFQIDKIKKIGYNPTHTINEEIKKILLKKRDNK